MREDVRLLAWIRRLGYRVFTTIENSELRVEIMHVYLVDVFPQWTLNLSLHEPCPVHTENRAESHPYFDRPRKNFLNPFNSFLKKKREEDFKCKHGPLEKGNGSESGDGLQ